MCFNLNPKPHNSGYTGLDLNKYFKEPALIQYTDDKLIRKKIA